MRGGQKGEGRRAHARVSPREDASLCLFIYLSLALAACIGVGIGIGIARALIGMFFLFCFVVVRTHFQSDLLRPAEEAFAW